jgi:hypothetical protein
MATDTGIPHQQILVTFADRLQTAGVDLVLAIDEGEPENHHHVVFRYPIDDPQVAAFVGVWDDAEPNPTGGKRRTR